MIPTAHDRQAAMAYASDAVHAWIRHTTIGDRVVYHDGFLAIDRTQDPSVDGVATAYMYYAEKGVVHLSQERVEPGRYIYYAERARRLVPLTRARDASFA